jgi:hypothetical protein
MTELTADAVLKWIETAERDDLVKIADELIERQFAVHPDDVERESDGALDWDDDPDIDPALLEDALSRLRRKEHREGLHVLAVALGRDFDVLEKLPLVSA